MSLADLKFTSCKLESLFTANVNSHAWEHSEILLSLSLIPVASNSAGIMPSTERACATRPEGATTSNYTEPQYKNPAVLCVESKE